MRENGVRLTDEEKQSVREALGEGKETASKIAIRLGVGARSVYMIRRQMLAAAYLGQTMRDEEDDDAEEIAAAPAPEDPLTKDVGRQSWTKGAVLEIVSDKDNKFKIGATGDWHVGSKYFRQDVLTDLYRRFNQAGIKDVFNTGNWIEGDAKFNRFDVDVSGLDPQCRALVQALPHYPGMNNYAVWGDDHEGWYAQREGIDVGLYCEQVMNSQGRKDWHDIGFLEAHVILRNANSGEAAYMAIVHPGGGSAYAYSYRPQKIIESMEGGTKPAVLLLGHYHKLDPGLVRNVWYCQCGTVKDQDPFMRKKSIEAHVGGVIIEMEQDPRTGAIIGFNPGMLRYFERGYYAGAKWSHTGQVDHPPRSIGGL